ncbi:MAG: RNA methyltransferase [Bacteroidales bacterium]|nr:RNA methyltransferase [Bacteroidales bacterium]
MKKLSMEELHRITPEQFKVQEKVPVAVVLDSIRSMNNVGSIFRTCDAFKIEKLYLCGITACPPNKEISKTALGATESVDWEYAEDVLPLAEKLKQEGYAVLMVEQVDESRKLQDVNFKDYEKVALVVGNEIYGVDERLLSVCDAAVEIPQFGTKHSLNVTIAAGIVIWEAVRQMAL